MIIDTSSPNKVLTPNDMEVGASMILNMNITSINNIGCMWLPSNVQALVHPLDQGIIAMFKAR